MLWSILLPFNEIIWQLQPTQIYFILCKKHICANCIFQYENSSSSTTASLTSTTNSTSLISTVTTPSVSSSSAVTSTVQSTSAKVSSSTGTSKCKHMLKIYWLLWKGIILYHSCMTCKYLILSVYKLEDRNGDIQTLLFCV